MKLTQSFRPLSRPGEFPTKRGKREYETRKEFPSPREAWVVSYTFQTLKSYKCYTVSGPSRGLGGVLPKQHSENGYHEIVKFPSPLEAWVVSYCWFCLWPVCKSWVSGPSRGMGGFLPNVPNKLESQWRLVSVPYRGLGSFLQKQWTTITLTFLSFRPLSRYGWFPTK